jgi:translation elongation factor EF-Tu-like GTPase
MLNQHTSPSQQFQLTITDIFNIKNRGCAVLGLVEAGELRQGATLHIVGSSMPEIVTSTWSFEGLIRDSSTWVAKIGDGICLLFPNLTTEQLEIGMIITIA